MTDTEALLLVAVALYLSECIVLVKPGTIQVRERIRGGWRVELPRFPFGEGRRGVHVLPLVPPFVVVFHASLPDLSVSDGGVTAEPPFSLGYDRGRAEATIHAHGEVAARGERVVAGADELTRAASPAEARELAAWLQQLDSPGAGERSRKIERWIDDRVRASGLAARVAWVDRKVRWLALGCELLWMLTFVTAPALVIAFGAARTLVWILLGVWLISLALTWAFARLHRAIVPLAKGERRVEVAKMILCPPVVMRACDRIRRSALEGYDPLGVVVALVEGEEQRDWAERLTRDLAFPLAEGTPVAQSFRRRLGERFALRLRKKAGLTVDCSQAPEPLGAGHATYCPRCLAQYVIATGHCADCGTVTLRPLYTTGGRTWGSRVGVGRPARCSPRVPRGESEGWGKPQTHPAAGRDAPRKSREDAQPPRRGPTPNTPTTPTPSPPRHPDP